jgi:hypothetical protein
MATPSLVLRGGQQSNYRLTKRLTALRKLSPSPGAGAPVNAVAAALTTALSGANNDLTFTAKVKGEAGNDITITYVNPGEETATESVEVTGSDIVVTLRSVSAVLSTAAQVKAAIEANAAANALVSVANANANDGTGAVTAMAEDALEGGVDGTPAEAWEQRYHGGYIYLNASEAPATVSTANWRRWEAATY